MRLAIVHENWGAGAARAAHDLREGLAARGHDVAYFPRGAEETKDSLLRGLDEFRPDAIQLHSWYSWLPSSALAELERRAPLVWLVHDPRAWGTMANLCWDCPSHAWCSDCGLTRSKLNRRFLNRHFFRRLLLRKSYQKVTRLRLVAPSRWMERRLAATELHRFPIVYSPNGIDTKAFMPGPGDRPRLRIPETGRVILHSAWSAGYQGVSSRKGLPLVAQAFIEGVLPRFPDAKLAVAGESYAPNHPSVIPLGMVQKNDLPMLLQSVDVFATASLADNLPYGVLEAMACGLPIVGSRTGGIPEMARSGETGWTFDSGSLSGLVEALCSALAQGDKLSEFGCRSRAIIEREYGMDTFLEAHEQELAKAAGVQAA